MRTRKFIPVIIALILVMPACEKHPLEDRLNDDIMIINNDPLLLGERVSVIYGGLPLRVHPLGSGLKAAAGEENQITLRAEVSPPVLDGKPLQASHIRISGNTALVVYNTGGPEYAGGVDVFDIADASNPRLVQGVIFPSMDISSIDIDPQGIGNNNFIYLAGASDPDLDPRSLQSAAVVERVVANKANMFLHLDQPRRFHDLESYAGNDVKYFDNTVYATSGSGGGLSILNHGVNHRLYIPVPYARSIDTDGQSLVVYSALENSLIVMDMKGAVQRIITTGGEHFDGERYLEAKSTVRLKGNHAFVAAGTGGMEVFDINTGERTGWILIPEEYPGNNDRFDYVTNGVSVNGDLIFIANGGAGVFIAGLEAGGVAVPIGGFSFGDGSSANFIDSSGNTVFVATGKGGLKILEISR